MNFSNHPAFSSLANATQDELGASSLIFQASLKNQGLPLVVRDFPCISSRQKRCLFARSSMCATLVHRLFYGKLVFSYNSRLTKKYKAIIFARLNFYFSESHAKSLFERGMGLYHQFCFDRAILFLAHSAILNHLESHAWLSSIFFSRHDNFVVCGTIKIDQRKAFLLAKAGHEKGCIHSSALLGMHYIVGSHVSCDTRYGISLARESSAADSCFGHLVLAHCCLKVKDYYGNESRSIRLDKAEKLYKLAAKKGCYRAKNELCKGLNCF
jgi:hypothetical protein